MPHLNKIERQDAFSASPLGAHDCRIILAVCVRSGNIAQHKTHLMPEFSNKIQERSTCDLSTRGIGFKNRCKRDATRGACGYASGNCFCALAGEKNVNTIIMRQVGAVSVFPETISFPNNEAETEKDGMHIMQIGLYVFPAALNCSI